MATNNNRDVRLGIALDVSGEDDVQKLADSVRALAKEGDPAAAGFLNLATALDAAAAETARLTAAEKAAAAALAAGKAEIAAQVSATKLLKLTTDDATKSTTEFKAEIKARAIALENARVASAADAATLNTATAATNQAANAQKKLAQQAQAVVTAHREADAAALASADSLQGLATKYTALTASIAGVAFAAKPLYDLAVQTDTLNRVLTQIEGSSAGAAKQIEFLRDTANTAGVSVTDLSDAYVRFSSAARSSGIAAGDVNNVFQAVTKAAGNLGLSSEKVTLILDALGQMASKGVVQMEELRGQLGDSLPGALGLAAKGLGLTQGELVKLVETGGLLTRDLLPALAAQLNAVSGTGAQVEGVSASFNRLKNAISEAGVSLLDGPLGQGAGVVLTALAGALRDVAVVAVGFNQALAVTGKTIALIGAAVTGSISSFAQFKTEFAEIMDDAATKVAKFEDRAYASGAAATKAGADAAAAAPQVAAVGQAFTATATAASQAAQASTAAGTAAAGSATAHAALATATTQAAGAATNATVSWAKLAVDYANVTAEADRQVKLADKQVASTKLAGEATAALAHISGDAYTALIAQASAADGNAKALENLAQKRQTDIGVIKAQIDAETILSAQLGDPDGARAKQIAELTKSLEIKTAETEATKQAAAAAALETEARKLALQTYADNSTALGTLRAAYLTATQAAKDMKAAQDAGIATSDDVAAANLRAAKATALYHDAVTDLGTAVKRQNDLTAANNNVSQGAINLDIARAKAAESVATAIGDSSTATEAHIRQLQLQSQAIDKSTTSKLQELDATKQATLAERDAISAGDPLRSQKLQEIDTRLKNIDALKLEEQARRAAIPAIDAEAAALQRHATAAAADLSASLSARNASFKDDPASAKNQIGSGSGFGTIANSDGKLNIPDGYAFDSAAYQRALASYLSGGLTSSKTVKAPNAQDYVIATATVGGAKPKVTGNGTGAGTSLYGPKIATPTDTSAAPTATPSASTSHAVSITINGGQTSTIQTASAVDASNLTGVLKSLEAAARSSGVQVNV